MRDIGIKTPKRLFSNILGPGMVELLEHPKVEIMLEEGLLLQRYGLAHTFDVTTDIIHVGGNATLHIPAEI